MLGDKWLNESGISLIYMLVLKCGYSVLSCPCNNGRIHIEIKEENDLLWATSLPFGFS